MLLLCCYPAGSAFPELGEALLDLLMEVVNIAPAQEGVVELPGGFDCTTALIKDTQIVFGPQTGVPGIAWILVNGLPEGLERQRILRRLVQGLTPKIIQIKTVVARQGRDDRGLEIGSQLAQGGGTQRILPLGALATPADQGVIAIARKRGLQGLSQGNGLLIALLQFIDTHQKRARHLPTKMPTLCRLAQVVDGLCGMVTSSATEAWRVAQGVQDQ